MTMLVLTTSPDLLAIVVMMLVATASLGVFLGLIHRESRHRRALRLAEWAFNAGFRPLDRELASIDALSMLGAGHQIHDGYFDARTVLCAVKFTSDGPGAATWNLAVCRLASGSATVGLQPVNGKRSLAEAAGLAPAPHQPANPRFVVLGEDLVATRRLAEGSTRALLPADIGLLRVGNWLVLDFSSRPFDEIELSRVRAVLDQLAALE
jgi:hypothetical protein